MSTGNRLEWRKSSFSGNGENCVEVAPSHGWHTTPDTTGPHGYLTPADSHIYLRHSKHPDAGTITFDLPTWDQFLTAARTETPGDAGTVTISHDGTHTVVHCHATGTAIPYDQGEWDAFRTAVDHDEFTFRPATTSRAGQ